MIGKIENSAPCKIVTHEDFNLKLGTRDYVADATHHATLGSNRPSGGFPPNRGNITLLWLFCYTVLFLDPTPRSNRRTDSYAEWLKWRVFHPRKCLLGVRTMGDVIWGKYSPKRGVNRQFQAKTPKSLHRNISGTINPTKIAIWGRNSDHERHFVGGPPLPQSKCNMADGRHLENRYDVIFQRRMFRFGRKSAAGCRMTRRLRWNGRDRNRK